MWHPPSSPTRSTPARCRNSRAARPRLEPLEGRVVLSVAFDSVVGIGNDAAGMTPADNAVDAAGNTYVTGILNATTDFDPANVRTDGSDILAPRGTSDAFVAKYAPDNTLLWARRMGSDRITSRTEGTTLVFEEREQGVAVVVDGSGSVFVTGTFYERADFGAATLTSAGSSDAFVARLDADGGFLWARNWGGGSSRDSGKDLALDASGNLVSIGDASYYNASGASTTRETQVRKYSPTGAVVWSKQVSNPGGMAEAVATDAAGNIYLGGSFSGTVDFDPDPKKTAYAAGAAASAQHGSPNSFVLKLSAAGAYGWVAPFVAKTGAAANSYVKLTDIVVDATGSIIAGGMYRGQVDVNPSASIDKQLPYSGDPFADGVVVKLSAAGSLAWSTSMGGARINGLAVDATGAVYTTGSFGSTFAPGSDLPIATTNGGTDAFVARLTPAGAVSWAWTFGGTSSEDVNAVALDASGRVYLAGYYNRTVDFDPDPLASYELTNPAYVDIFLLRLRQS